ncbi:hypothetical protein HCJ94_00550 [Micromonospora sp. HSS6-12]|uniref:Flagellar basal body protein FliL n=1 Tax=Micromonospora thermarum TaxID=2720024 RepID=A0ABX0YYH5_9ACTN|nr:hypothetical protein [Micromonospora thermarum]
MANYGPPDGTAGEPWRGRRAEDAYGPPEHGWRDPYPPGPTPGTYPSGYGSPPRHDDVPHAGYGPQGYGGEPYRPAYAPWSPPADGRSAHSGDPGGPAGDPASPSRPSRRRGPLIAVLAAVLLLVLGGGATVLYLLGQGDPTPPAASPTAAAAPGSAGPDQASPAPSVAAPESSADPRFVKVGQCVRNDGPAGGKPKLLISECATRTYEVLHRVDGPTTGEKDAAAKCAKVDNYTNWYFFDSELDTLDFVLCLKQR